MTVYKIHTKSGHVWFYEAGDNETSEKVQHDAQETFGDDFDRVEKA